MQLHAPDTRGTDPSQMFRFDMVAEALEKSKIDGRSGRFIGGYVSTSHMDRQGETLIQEGLDFSHFLSKGWFNDNHDSAADALVGYPTMARLDKIDDIHKGWYVEGELLPEGANKRADALWGIAQGLKKANADRKLGFSVEGSVKERDPTNPKKVRKAEVREVAITRCPINTRTSLDVLAKSLAAGTPGVSDGPGDAGPLQPEALEGTKKKKKKKLRKSAAVELLMLINPKCPRPLAERVVEYAARHYPTA